MIDLPLPEVSRLVAAANAARWQSGLSERAEDPGDAERRLDAFFRTSQTLAVYGTLAPGQPNHHVVAPLGGSGRTAWSREICFLWDGERSSVIQLSSLVPGEPLLR